MAYHGYIPFIKESLFKLDNPKVLEVGLDKGVTTIPTIVFLARAKKKFEFVGVDVLIQEPLLITLRNIDVSKEQKISLFQDNSLNILPKFVENSFKFDVVLLDGDHNYFTVSKELEHLNDLVSDGGLVIIDDYHGRWAEKDLWYAERDGYEKVETATKKVETQKHGVKPAVDEFLLSNSHWETFTLMNGEPIVLRKRN